jgi:hypothetical protein
MHLLFKAVFKFPGLNMVFRLVASALNELAARAGLLAHDYNKLVGFVAGASRDGIISDARFAGRVEKIDLSAADPAAEEDASTMVRNAVIFAKAQTLSFFDEDARAVEILKPMLRGEINQSQRPST